MLSITYKMDEALKAKGFSRRNMNTKWVMYINKELDEVIDIKFSPNFLGEGFARVYFKRDGHWRGRSCATNEAFEFDILNFIENRFVEPPFYNVE